MAKTVNATQQGRYRTRRSFAKIPDVMEVPNLIAVQTESFDWFIREGIAEAFRDICPIESSNKEICLDYVSHTFEKPKKEIDECRDGHATYEAALKVTLRLINRATGEIKEQSDVYMGSIPMMTPRGTFIINGTERVVVNQLVRSAGVYFSSERDKTSDKIIFASKIIPNRGAWLEFETDKRDVLNVRIDRKRKQPATILLRALDIAVTNKDITNLFGNNEMILNTLARDNTETKNDALMELFKRFRPGEPVTVDTAAAQFNGMFSSSDRYDLAKVGRYKVDKKLGFDRVDGYDRDERPMVLTKEDIVATLRYLIALHDGEAGYKVDDIDHFGNRRIRTVGELVQNQFRIGLSRMDRNTVERMNSANEEYIDSATPGTLINIRPIVSAIKEFFGSSQLSQFMDQANPATGITHKRRLSALGPGGLSRERAGFEVRDVHTSHYGRMCPIETPEGSNIGLIGSLATYARVNEYGFIETPYRKVVEGKVTDEIVYMAADEEENYTIAQANALFDPLTREFGYTDKDGMFHKSEKVLCRTKDSAGVFGDSADIPPARVDYMDVSPRQMTSVATALIPFLEHDDANRALMGSNMQRQAVPLLRPTAPLVGTGIEHRIAVDSGETVVAKHAGVVDYVDGQVISVTRPDGTTEEYPLHKFKRTNQNGCISERPIVRPGDQVNPGDVLADGPSCNGGELALGQNLLIAYMPWEGYNYEDAIIVSERVVAEDLLTSITIAEYSVDTRETKLGLEEITRDVPNAGDDAVKDLDSNGIICIGAEVKAHDILVGKVTPKGEAEQTAEMRLLHAIFGEKSREVRDTSLRVPHGAGGRVIDVKVFTRDQLPDAPAGVTQRVYVYVAQKRKVQQGDKLSGRHGNKGVISRVLPVEDMPYLADGTPIDVILNPLGVPSRMNVGQLLENHLGWAAKWGWSDDPNSTEPVEGPIYVSTPVFDGASEQEIADCIEAANRNLINKNRAKYGDLARDEFVPQLSRTGKTWLYDGRTGEKFREPITVGETYILKLGHMVDDKIHARSIGPYSLITQQPLGGKAQFGGQRFGEMEVWALYAYGASNVLQEILTFKSDDTNGRVKAYEAITRGENTPAPEVPESFKVLVKEMRSLCLNVQLEGEGMANAKREKEQAIKDETALAEISSAIDEAYGNDNLMATGELDAVSAGDDLHGEEEVH